jgi:Trp operon repressor
MSFKHLEDNLSDGHISPYLGFLKGLQEPTRTVLRYTLDIASTLNSNELLEKYSVFGGYAVLSNLMNAFGDSVAKVWRGSEDIDLGGNHDVLKAIKSGYHVFNDLPSPNIPDKRTLKLDIDGEKECKIDFYLGDVSKEYGCSQVNSHFGIPLRVVKPEYVIRGKLKISEPEMKHYGDILAMLSVLEKQGKTPTDILKILNHKEMENLQKRIVIAEQEFGKDRLAFFPNETFSEKLKRELHLRKPIK